MSPAHSHLGHSSMLGIACMAFAIFLYNAANIIVKGEADAYPMGEILFFRFVFAMIPAFLVVFFSKGWKGFRVVQLPQHALRALYGTLAVLCVFLSVKLLPLSEAATLYFTTSLFVTLLTGVMLKEHVGAAKWAAILIGFAAILFMNPPHAAMGLGVIIGLAAAFFDSLNMIYSRKLSHRNPGTTIHFYYILMGIGLSALLLIPGPKSFSFPLAQEIFGWKPVDGKFLQLMAIIGIGGGFGQFFVTLAHKYASPPVVAPIIYTSLLWAVIFDFFIFSIPPSTRILSGAGIIILCGLFVAHQERKRSTRA